jgi:hypothetical protein
LKPGRGALQRRGFSLTIDRVMFNRNVQSPTDYVQSTGLKTANAT